MYNLRKMGGTAALVEAATYLVGIVIAFTVLASTWEMDTGEYVAFLVDNQIFMHIWHLVIYLVNGFFLIVLVLALNERLKGNSPALAQVATAVGLIWAGLVIASGLLIINDLGVVAEIYGRDPAQATTVWLAVSAVEDGLGGAVELPGGVWVLLVSLTALRHGELPKLLNYLGLVVGGAGVVSAGPMLGDLGVIFGLGSIVWFVWLGVVMLRDGVDSAVVQEETVVPQLDQSRQFAGESQ